METFIPVRSFVNDPNFQNRRQDTLNGLNFNDLDTPVIDIIKGFIKLPYCFTLQSCYGHFVHDNQRNPENITPLAATDHISDVEYRIAYIAVCIQYSDSGKLLFDDLRKIPEIDPKYIQFGSAQWFWRQHVNSYALQVEPERYKEKDSALVDFQEALHIEKVRNKFFSELKLLILKRTNAV